MKGVGVSDCLFLYLMRMNFQLVHNGFKSADGIVNIVVVLGAVFE